MEDIDVGPAMLGCVIGLILAVAALVAHSVGLAIAALVVIAFFLPQCLWRIW